MANASSIDGNDTFTRSSSGFVAWFKSIPETRLSSKIKLTDMRSDQQCRGVVAVESIEEDEELFSIPASLVLTAYNSSLSPAVLDSLKHTGQWPPLMVAIIHEYLKADSSTWKPYFSVLPTHFNSLMWWSEVELAELQASAVVEKVGKNLAEESWNETIIPLMLKFPRLFPVQGCDDVTRKTELIRLAHMAGSLIMAYAFDVDRDGEFGYSDSQEDDEEFEEDDEDEPLKAMVPFADMLNADADRNNARLFQDEGQLIMKATKTIMPGDEVFNDYGPLPRSDLLRMYGYITDNYTKYDVVEISHALLEEVACKTTNKVWETRRNALDELGVLDDGYTISKPEESAQLKDAVSDQLHMVICALCTDDKQTNPTKPPRIGESWTADEAMLLSAVLQKRLSEYPTTSQQDEELLKSLSQTPNGTSPGLTPERYRMAVEVRRGEKEILNLVIRLCRGVVEQQTTAAAIGTAKRRHDSTNGPRKTARTKN